MYVYFLFLKNKDIRNILLLFFLGGKNLVTIFKNKKQKQVVKQILKNFLFKKTKVNLNKA